MVDQDAAATGECSLSDCFCHEVQQSTFDRKWQQAPQSMKRTTEYEAAAYWCEIGRQLERGKLVAPVLECLEGLRDVSGCWCAAAALRDLLTNALED